MKIKKTFIIIISIFFVQLFSDNSISVEPDEVLKNKKLEFEKIGGIAALKYSSRFSPTWFIISLLIT